MDSYSSEKVFDASLFVSIRRRMGQEVFDEFAQSIQHELSQVKRRRTNVSVDNDSDEDPPSDTDTDTDGTDQSSEEPQHEELQGKLILDATVADQAIRYPTDVSLLNEARELTEKIIDRLYQGTELKRKPRTYRQKARRDYLSFAKRRKLARKTIRKAIKQQLQYVATTILCCMKFNVLRSITRTWYQYVFC